MKIIVPVFSVENQLYWSERHLNKELKKKVSIRSIIHYGPCGTHQS